MAVDTIDTDLLRAYSNGYVAVSEFGVGLPDIVLPDDPTEALSGDFGGVGALTEDGINEAINQDRTDIFIWQGGALGRSIPGQTNKTWTLSAAEQNLRTLGIHYSGSVIEQTAYGAKISERAPGPDRRVWVLHCIDGTRIMRIVVPQGEITERGEMPINSTGITVFEWTLTGYPDPDGFFAYRYYLDDALAIGS